jgi:small ligand-binding sensory domain FIST
MKAEAAVASGTDWRTVLDEVLAGIPMLAEDAAPELALLFASDSYGDELPALIKEARRRTGARVLLGCSSQGVIGPDREIEDAPGVALQVLSLPGAVLTAARLEPDDLQSPQMARVWSERLGGLKADEVSAWVFFVDPYSANGEVLLQMLDTVNKGVPLVGGLASGDQGSGGTYVFLNDEVFKEGVVGVALGGPYSVRTVVSQGAAPIGETWTITSATRNVIHTIGGRPALEVLQETFTALDPEMQRRAERNLLVGLAMDEYRDEFHRGDFLIRNLAGVDNESGSIAIGALPREGQTIQFQVRDPRAADEELQEMLTRTKAELGDQQPIGALLCSCNGRGIGLFGTPDHDAHAISQLLGPLPVAGFFCNGEIGPVGARNFLHGFTASIALILPKPAE